MEEQPIKHNKEEHFEYKNQAAAEKALKETKKKMHEATSKAAKLKADLSSMKYDATKAIVASNLVVAATIINATRKTQTDSNSSLHSAVEEAVRAFETCVPLLKGEE